MKKKKEKFRGGQSASKKRVSVEISRPERKPGIREVMLVGNLDPSNLSLNWGGLLSACISVIRLLGLFDNIEMCNANRVGMTGLSWAALRWAAGLVRDNRIIYQSSLNR